MVAQEPDWLKYDKGEPKKEKPAAIAAMSAGRTSMLSREERCLLSSTNVYCRSPECSASTPHGASLAV